jgi:prophage antirepressor-like protein
MKQQEIKMLMITKEFEGKGVDIILDPEGEPLFELYSTGMAVGYTKIAKGKVYAQKDRIEKTMINAGIKPVVQGVQQYLNEDMLYDFMLEAKTDKCREFRTWVKGVLKQLRKTGVVILENAESEAIDFEKKYGKYRIRKTFMNSNFIEADYREFKELSQSEWKAKRLDNDDRIKLCNIICGSLETRLKENMADMKGSEMLLLRETITEIKDDIIKLANKKHGGIKAGQTKEIKQLEEQNDKLIQKYIKLIHKRAN